MICPGGQAALVTAVRALAAARGTVLVESPTYRGALAGVRAAGLTPLPVPSDADGIRPELLAEALERTGARVVYLQPLHANPHGADLAAGRRAEVLAIAAAAGRLPDRGRLGPRPHHRRARGLLPSAADDADGHVVYVRSLSKGASPGLRVAAVAARGPAGARLRAARVVEDLFVSAPLQQAALDLVSSPGWRRHLKALRAGAARAPGRARRRRRARLRLGGRDRPRPPAGACICGCTSPTGPTRRR